MCTFAGDATSSLAPSHCCVIASDVIVVYVIIIVRPIVVIAVVLSVHLDDLASEV